MTDDDFDRFAEMLNAVYSMYGKSLDSPIAKTIFFRALSDYPLDMVRAAFDAHVKNPERGQFPPKPADLILHIDKGAKAGRPNADEAWSIALDAMDETATVIVNDEIVEAWAKAAPIYRAGDKVGARMAFRSAYERILETASGPPRWWPSFGTDANQRYHAIEAGIARGLLPAPDDANPQLAHYPQRLQ